MEHPRTHSVTAAATTPGSTRNSSTSSGTHPHAHAHPGGAAKGKAKQGSCSSGAGGPTATVPTNTNTDNPTTSTSTTTSPTPPALGVSADRQHALALALGENSPALALAIGEGKDAAAGSGESGDSGADSGTATPVALPGPRANPNLFKQFDSKTGQFLRTQAEVRAAANASGVVPTGGGAGVSRREHSKEPVPPTQHMPHPQLPQPANKGNTATAPQFRLVSNFRNRSHSVPTILHSSLRRISNHGNVYHGGVNTPTIITHPMNPYGIGKKKQRAHAHAHGNALNTTSIRNAILLSQQAISAGEASASPSAQDKNGVGHRHTAGVKVKSAYSNKNIGINIHAPGKGSDNTSAPVSFEDRVSYVRAIRQPIPLPPINLQCLKEIDLQEIVKNPQLRHDIIFDPLLQFRPNLDGERGIKKKQLSDIYWRDVENELIVYAKRPEVFDYSRTRLVPLFDTLREVLLTIVPQKEAHQINNILDTELNVQELIKGSLVMTNLSNWLATLFKHHCAPMRDTYVDKMSNKFREAEAEGSLPKFMDGLKLVFQILEAMKLDIANHQIRLLRPALLSNAVEFEKQYFNSLITSRNALLKSSLVWFENKMDEYVTGGQLPVADKDNLTVPEVYKGCVKAIISLLSCRKMVREFPTSLSFDHARLILLRADIRQLVCLLVCRLLFQQLVANDASLDKPAKVYINTTYTNKKLKDEIISIITDEHGNCRWTKNTLSISVHLCKVIEDLRREHAMKQQRALDESKNDSEDITMADSDEDTAASSSTAASTRQQLPPALDNEKIRFAKSWLSKQTQPLSEVYGVLEARVFKSLEDGIYSKSNCTVEGRVKQDFVYLYNSTTAGAAGSAGTDDGNSGGNTAAASAGTGATATTNASITFKTQDEAANAAAQNSTRGSTPAPSGNGGSGGLFAFTDSEEFENVYRHLYTVINLHWSVFGAHYVDTLGDRMAGEPTPPLQ